MSENIDNDAAVEDTQVEETAVPETPAVEVPVVEEAPVTEAPVVEEPVKPAAPVNTGNAGTIADKGDTVVVYASRNVTLSKLGKSLTEGFNVIPTSEARQWLALGSVRPATPVELKGSGK